jgi:hypothetical protein
MSAPTTVTSSTSNTDGNGPIKRSEADQRLTVVEWRDPIADPHGMHPCSRYVELYWLGILGPSTTWLLRRLFYGLETHRSGFELDMPETARALGLGDRLGKNAPFRRALQRLHTFELARPYGPGAVAVRTRIPPLPLRHLSRLPATLQASHRIWSSEQRLDGVELMRRRAHRLAEALESEGWGRDEVERVIGASQFHPAVAFAAVDEVFSHRGGRRPGGLSTSLSEPTPVGQPGTRLGPRGPAAVGQQRYSRQPGSSS